MRGPNTDTRPTRVPEPLRLALLPYRVTGTASSRTLTTTAG